MQEHAPRQTRSLNSRGQIVATFGDNGKPFTPADHEAFKRLPGGGEWFEAERVDPCVRNPRWRCDRLVAMGVLESTVTGGTPTSLCTLFRKLEPVAPVHAH